MKVSLSTIKQFIDFELPPVDELVRKVNQQLGGVEQIIDVGAKYKDAVIVKVLSAVKHENADKLSVCIIDDGGATKGVERGGDGHVQVVCGAPNVHAGMFAIWLPPGSTVPASVDTTEPFVLAARDIRGVTSHGMLAASDELAIGSDHEGIVEINPNEWRPYDVEIKPGASFAACYGLDDTVIDIENKMFTHRPDLFGQLGVAREIAGIYHQSFASPAWYLQAAVASDRAHSASEERAEEGGLQSSGVMNAPEKEQAPSDQYLGLKVTNDAGGKAPRFMAVAIKGVEVGPSPLWLQCALVAMGSKAINNIVDVTNYVMLLTAQPTHAYDYDKLRGAKLGVRMAQAGEKAELLNGKSYQLTEDDIVIVDGEGPVGLGGIMGGGNSEVSASTKNIVLEVANFDMYTVRKTSMRYGLFTDAVTRFNKGQSPLQNDRVLQLLMQSIYDVAGGERASSVFDLKNHEATRANTEIEVSNQFINDRLGLSLRDQDIKSLLENVEFTCTVHDSSLMIQTPFWRTDIVDPEDIVEEVGRLYGFEKLPRELPKRSIMPVAENPIFVMKQAVRRVLSVAGANEVLTYSFVHERTLKGAGQDPADAYQLGNALSPDLQYYRLSLTPSLLGAVHGNIKAGHDEFALFELGKAHNKKEQDNEALPKEAQALAYTYAAKKAQPGAAYYHARRALQLLLDRSGITSLRFEPLEGVDLSADPWLEQMIAPFNPARSAVLRATEDASGGTKGLVWGVVGEYKAAARRAFKLPAYNAGFELDPLMFIRSKGKVYIPLSRYPYVTQDISLKVPAAVAYDELFATANDALNTVRSDELRLTLVPLGIYHPEGTDTKTITLRLTAVNYDRTLTDAEVTTYMQTIATAAAAKQKAQTA